MKSTNPARRTTTGTLMRSVADSADASTSASCAARKVSACAATDSRMRAPSVSTRLADEASWPSSRDVQPGAQVAECRPHRLVAAAPGGVEGLADLGERPAVAAVGRVLQRGFGAGAGGDHHVDEVEVRAVGVAERGAGLLGPLGQPEVGDEEPADGQQRGEQEDGQRHDRQAGRGEHQGEEPGRAGTDQRPHELGGDVLLHRGAGHGQVGGAGGRVEAHAGEADGDRADRSLLELVTGGRAGRGRRRPAGAGQGGVDVGEGRPSGDGPPDQPETGTGAGAGEKDGDHGCTCRRGTNRSGRSMAAMRSRSTQPPANRPATTTRTTCPDAVPYGSR